MIYWKYNIIIDKEHTNGKLLEVNHGSASIFNNRVVSFGTNTFKAKLRWLGVLKDSEILKRDSRIILKSEIAHDFTFIEKRRIVRFRSCILQNYEMSVDSPEECICTYSYDYNLTTFNDIS